MTNSSSIPASLAPMAGYTDSAFRRICGELGAVYAVSEMISAEALTRSDRETAELSKIGEGEPPVVLQIFGRDPGVMARAADLLLSGNYPGCSYAAPPAGIDINMGCPVRKIVSNGEGSALMLDPDRAERIAAAVKEVCLKYGVPLSVKIRMGWDSLTAPEFSKILARAGVDRITLHCRTRAQMYMPSADPEAARITLSALREEECGRRILFTGNGDVCSPESARVYLDMGCGDVAVGRAALGDPWLFRRLKDPENAAPPTPAEIRETVIRLVEESAREKGEIRGIRESRSRAAYFIRGMRGSAALRDRLNRAESLGEFLRLVEEFRFPGEFGVAGR